MSNIFGQGCIYTHTHTCARAVKKKFRMKYLEGKVFLRKMSHTKIVGFRKIYLLILLV